MTWCVVQTSLLQPGSVHGGRHSLRGWRATYGWPRTTLTTYMYNGWPVPIRPRGVSATTCNVTGRHRGPKRKLRAGYRAPSRNRTCYVPSVIFCLLGVVHCNTHHICDCRVWYIARFLCAMYLFEVPASSSSPKLPLCQISSSPKLPLCQISCLATFWRVYNKNIK